MMRPKIVVILAMSADGKISDGFGKPAQFGSSADRAHLETQIAQADGVLIGANTLRAYHTSLTLREPRLLAQRAEQGQAPQPLHFICSGSGKFDPAWRFFSQSIPRGLISTPQGVLNAQGCDFDHVLISSTSTDSSEIVWTELWHQFQSLGIHQLAVLGGGELVASLGAIAAIDELWLTVCPCLIGGRNAPTPYDGVGMLLKETQSLELLSHRIEGQEVFLHYRVAHPPANPAAAVPLTAAAPDRQLGQSLRQTE